MLNGHHTCQFTGQARGQLADGRFELVGLHRGDGADDRGFLLGAVGHHHHFFQLVGLRCQFHDEFLLVADGDLVVVVSEKTDDKDVGGLDRNFESAGAVGHHTAGFPFDGDEGSGDRSVRLVQNGAFHVAGLCMQGKSRKTGEHREEDFSEC